MSSGPSEVYREATQVPSWWIYTEGADEAGTVQPGTTAKEAYINARRAGWDPEGGVVWCWQLGDGCCLGRRGRRRGQG